MSKTHELFIEWEGLHRNDEDAPLVRVHFTAGGWQPYCPAYWTDYGGQPAEGGIHEDIFFVRAEIDPRDASMPPLTEAEIGEARAWFESEKVQDLAQREAEREMKRCERSY